jgi:hypothetical protein
MFKKSTLGGSEKIASHDSKERGGGAALAGEEVEEEASPRKDERPGSHLRKDQESGRKEIARFFETYWVMTSLHKRSLQRCRRHNSSASRLSCQ